MAIVTVSQLDHPLGTDTSDASLVYSKNDLDTVKAQTLNGSLKQKNVTVTTDRDTEGEVIGVIAVDALGIDLSGSDNQVALPCPPYCGGKGKLIDPVSFSDYQVETAMKEIKHLRERVMKLEQE